MFGDIMKTKIINILKSYSIDKKIIDDFFCYQNLNNCNLENVQKKTTVYPICDLNIIGVYPKLENNILIDYKLRLPKPDNLYNSLIYIHETIHGLILENNINNFFDDDNYYEEILPMLYEDLFINYLDKKNIYHLNNLYNKYIQEKYYDINIDEKYTIARFIINNLSYESKHDNNIKIKMIKNNFYQ